MCLLLPLLFAAKWLIANRMLTWPLATEYIGIAVAANKSQILFSEEYAGAYGRSDNRFSPGDLEGEAFKNGVQAFLLNQ